MPKTALRKTKPIAASMAAFAVAALAVAGTAMPSQADTPPVGSESVSDPCLTDAVPDDLGIVPDIVEADGVYDSETDTSGAPEAEVVLGGTVQHTDPTRDDYVPPVNSECSGEIVPLDAAGFEYISAFNFNWNGLTIPIPRGQLHHQVKGNGLKITAEGANYVVAARPCNVQIKFQNRWGSSIYSTVSSPIYGCGNFFEYINPTDRTLKRGVQCARLYVNGYYKGEQCHSITP